MDKMSYTIFTCFNFQVSFGNNDSGIWWRPLPQGGDCFISALSESPSVIPVENIRVLCEPPVEIAQREDTQLYSISFTLVWDPPQAPFGEIMSYDVSISDAARGDSEGRSLIIEVRYSLETFNSSVYIMHNYIQLIFFCTQAVRKSLYQLKINQFTCQGCRNT